MNVKRCVGLLVLLLGLPALGQPSELIPRKILFGNPVKTLPRLSPDGTRLFYLAPSDKGVLNVWVQTRGKDDATMVTNDTVRGIRQAYWDESGNGVLYLQDTAGDENWHV